MPKQSLPDTFFVHSQDEIDQQSGRYHGLPKSNLQSYLDEYCFRFSRRSFGGALLDRLALAISSSIQLN